MKVAQYGTASVVIHAIANRLHSLAHVQIPVPRQFFATDLHFQDKFYSHGSKICFVAF